MQHDKRTNHGKAWVPCSRTRPPHYLGQPLPLMVSLQFMSEALVKEACLCCVLWLHIIRRRWHSGSVDSTELTAARACVSCIAQHFIGSSHRRKPHSLPLHQPQRFLQILITACTKCIECAQLSAPLDATRCEYSTYQAKGTKARAGSTVITLAGLVHQSSTLLQHCACPEWVSGRQGYIYTYNTSCRKSCVLKNTAPYLAALWWRCPSPHSSTPPHWDTAPLHRQCVGSGIAGSYSDSHIAPPGVLSASASLAYLPGEADSAMDLQKSASVGSKLAKPRCDAE